ncbi:MAG: hypothetical protein QM817_41320 [Archangium sp.]
MHARTLALLSLAAVGCGPIPGPQDIIISDRQQVLFSSATPGPFAAWESADLTPLPGLSLPDIPGFWFDVEFTGHPQESSFVLAGDTTNPIVLRTTPQLYLFTRNPQEFYETITSMSVDRWTTEVHTPRNGPDISGAPPYHLPAALVLESEPWRATETAAIPPRWFWTTTPSIFTNPAAWLGIGSDPGGTGSIKALRLKTLPKCSTAVDLQETLVDLKGEIALLASGAACRRGALVDVKTDLIDFTAITYFAHEAPPGGVRTLTTGLRDGLLVSGRVHAQVTSDLINSSCDVDFAYDYTWTVLNGYVTVSPRRVFLDAADPTTDACAGLLGEEGALDRLAEGLEVTLPQKVYAKAVDRQQFPPVAAANTAPFNTPAWQCQYGSVATDPTECQSARQELRLAALAGASNLSANLSQSEIDTMVNTIADPSRWRCRPPSQQELANDCAAGQPVRGRCQFAVPAVGVVAEPDRLQVAPFWEPNDTAQPGTALFYASFGTGSRTAYQSLCTPPRGNPYNGPTPRSFAGIAPAPLICTWPDPQKLGGGVNDLVPADHLVCPCTTNNDCALGDRCITELGSRFCEQSCLTDAQCNTGTCDRTLLLCTGQRCFSDSSCPLWRPHCRGADIGSPGYCEAQ